MNKRTPPTPLARLTCALSKRSRERLSFNAPRRTNCIVTQSAVSRQIKALEDELGAPLFVRGTRQRAETTPDGQALLRRRVEPMARAARRRRAARSGENRGRRRVSVTTFASFGVVVAAAAHRGLPVTATPTIDIRVSAQDAMAELEDPELDLALRYCSPKQVAPRGGGAPVRRGADAGHRAAAWSSRSAQWPGAPPLAAPGRPGRPHARSRRTTTAPAVPYLSWRQWLACHDKACPRCSRKQLALR